VNRALEELRHTLKLATYSVGDYVYCKSPAGYRRLGRIVSARPQSQPRGRRELWLVKMRGAVRWEVSPLWLPVECALSAADVSVQRQLGFIDAKGEPS
jgi:hypothetical protein